MNQLLASAQGRVTTDQLEKRKSSVQTFVVTINANGQNDRVLTDKEMVMDLLCRLPDNVSLYEIAQKLEFMAAVRQGLAEFDDNKDSISIEQVERELTSWSVTVGRKRRGRQKRKAGDSLKSPASSPNA